MLRESSQGAEVTDISFRAAVPADALCLSVLGTQVFLDTYATQGIRPAIAREVVEHFSIEAVAGLLASPSMTILVAEQAGHLIGFAQLTRGSRHELVPCEPAVELNRLYVQEPFTSKGVGRALLQQAEELAVSQGARLLADRLGRQPASSRLLCEEQLPGDRRGLVCLRERGV
jgi:GNAT superfamily N-acetyltransferase